jgi:hypothetical protein
MGADEIAGVRAAANWNSAGAATGSLANLKRGDGSATTSRATWSSPPTSVSTGVYAVGLADAPGNARMLNGYLDPTSPSAPATVTVTDLPAEMANGGYDVYVYTLNHLLAGTRTYSYTLGGTTYLVSQSAPSPSEVPSWSTFTPGSTSGTANYVVFRNLRGSAFTLTATPTGAIPRAPVNGIQIVAPPGP